ncbi:hypothetical protein FB451DRAFT_212929 [Mycena latifolia]|nr:hypothetical protein FB451DRAFT_212929 [Mycena latifolia]
MSSRDLTYSRLCGQTTAAGDRGAVFAFRFVRICLGSLVIPPFTFFYDLQFLCISSDLPAYNTSSFLFLSIYLFIRRSAYTTCIFFLAVMINGWDAVCSMYLCTCTVRSRMDGHVERCLVHSEWRRFRRAYRLNGEFSTE